MTTALLLSGAGSRGILQYGYLQAVVDSGIKIDSVYGTSVGALNGALYLQDEMAKLWEIWLTVNNSKIYKSGPMGLFRMFSPNKACLYDSTPLHVLLQSVVDFSAIQKNPKPFKIAATNLVQHTPVIKAASEFANVEDFTKFLLASASPPVFFPPVEINGDLFSDGGISSNFNIAEAVRDGADTLIVLRPTPLYKISRPKNIIESMVLALGIATERYLERELGFVDRLNQVQDEKYRTIKVVYITSDNFGIDLLDFNYKQPREWLINNAYNSARQQLEKAIS
jgi:predicted acylesterase/phospholipase RssA